MEQAKKDQIAFGKKFPFTFIYGERTIIEQVGHTGGADFSKIKPTTGTDETSLIVTCLPLSMANILLRDRMMEFFSASWDASLQMKQAVNESSWFKSIT